MADAIYLDHNASTPCDHRVVEAMMPYFGTAFANPSSSSHRPGQEAAAVLEEARGQVARCLGADSATEITFTSGATEANNLILKGLASAQPSRRHLITQATEHASVLEPLRQLARQGLKLTVLGVDGDGRIRLEELEQALRDDTLLLSLMLANNETGTVQAIAEAAELLSGRGVLLHCDAAQGPGKLPVDVAELGVDFLCLSAHKAYGPKGIGAAYIRRRRPPLKLPPLLDGGGQESGLRSGTPNLPAAVGMAEALEIAAAELDRDAERAGRLRDRLERSILGRLEGCTVNGASVHRLPGTSNISFAGVEGNALLASLPELALSSGSACTSSHPEPSPVLQAMGVEPELAAASLRFSLGRSTTEQEIDHAAERVVQEVKRLRGMRRRR